MAGVDQILDIAETAINVTGDGSGAVVVAATGGELTPPHTGKADILGEIGPRLDTETMTRQLSGRHRGN